MKLQYLSILLVLSLCLVSSQAHYVEKEQLAGMPVLQSPVGWDTARIKTAYPFIKLRDNKLSYAGDSTVLYPFYQKLRDVIATQTGKINIVHVGGSHVQAGVLTGKIRSNLQGMATGLQGQYGFFFPHKMAHTNSAAEVKVSFTGTWRSCRAVRQKDSCDWGLAAMLTATTDSITTCNIRVLRQDSTINYNFTSALIYHNTALKYYSIEPIGEDATLYTDSAKGYTQITYTGFKDSLQLRFVKVVQDTLARFELQGIQLLNDIPGVTYTGVGANGASVPTYLRCSKLELHLENTKPDLVVFGVGINDANVLLAEFKPEEYKQQYKLLMQRFRTVNPDVKFIFLTNNDSYFKRKYPNRNALKVRDVMLELSKEEGAAVWNFFDIMGGLASIRKWELSGLAKRDKVHLTNAGYTLAADLFFDALKKDFENYLNNSKPKP